MPTDALTIWSLAVLAIGGVMYLVMPRSCRCAEQMFQSGPG